MKTCISFKKTNTSLSGLACLFAAAMLFNTQGNAYVVVKKPVRHPLAVHRTVVHHPVTVHRTVVRHPATVHRARVYR